jgi:hypothetical protein
MREKFVENRSTVGILGDSQTGELSAWPAMVDICLASHGGYLLGQPWWVILILGTSSGLELVEGSRRTYLVNIMSSSLMVRTG